MEEEDFEKQETGAAVTRCVEVTGGGKPLGCGRARLSGRKDRRERGRK